MSKFSKRQNRLALLVVSLFLTIVLSSCRQLAAETSTEELTAIPPITTPEAVYAGVDEVGEYMIGSTKSLHFEDGSMIGIEERVYESLAKSRFIVTQQQFEFQAQSMGLEAIHFYTYQGGSSLKSNNMDTNFFLASTPINLLALSSETIVTSELYDYGFDDSAELLNSKENQAKKVCGSIQLEYINQTFEPMILDTCQHPYPN